MNYHRNIQPLVTYMETLRGRFSAKGYTTTLSPSGQNTTAGYLGVTMAVVSVTEEHTYEVEDAKAADNYLTIRVDGEVRSFDQHRGGRPMIGYGRDIVAFMTPNIETFIALLPKAA